MVQSIVPHLTGISVHSPHLLGSAVSILSPVPQWELLVVPTRPSLGQVIVGLCSCEHEVKADANGNLRSQSHKIGGHEWST